MTIWDQIALLSPADGVAVALLVAANAAIAWWIERDTPGNRSVSAVMSDHRRAWMREMVTREVRIFDAQIMTSLRQGTAFFASTNIIAIGGVLALVRSPDPLVGAAEIVGQPLPAVLWQIKLILVALYLASAFLRFVWANRLFGYSAVLMASVPNDPGDPTAFPRADQAAEMNIRAAINFNRGLRSMYFAIGALAWLFGPWALIGATLITVYVIWSREFMSAPHRILSRLPPSLPDDQR